jgi:4-hydroxybenzoate polyprenyltransferase
VVNDLRDVEEDRRHPVKRERPIARGELSTSAALGLAGALAVVSVALVVPLGVWSIVFLLAFGALQAAYSLGLKHVVLIDVMAIGGLFVLRAAAGAEAVDVRISPWLLLCTALLALFLAFAKRRGELVLVGADRTPGRPVLEGYSLELVDQLVSVVAASTVIAYSLYTFTARDSKALMATIPFVLFGVFRYLLLIHRHDLGEEPEQVLLKDAPILLAVAGWIVTATTILVLT